MFIWVWVTHITFPFSCCRGHCLITKIIILFIKIRRYIWTSGKSRHAFGCAKQKTRFTLVFSFLHNRETWVKQLLALVLVLLMTGFWIGVLGNSLGLDFVVEKWPQRAPKWHEIHRAKAAPCMTVYQEENLPEAPTQTPYVSLARTGHS